MTTITLSSNLKKRCMISILTNQSSIVNYKKQNLPDLVNDIYIEEQQRQETIINIAILLRKVGDQIDEQFHINNTSSSSNQRIMTFMNCLSHVLSFFL
ncbi:unnamed protein product [Adineta steineri]|uniref:Uncharacterized protein n=1 Tax=Adineta steineri TaxID=433720 RepID=A0A819TH01_9BILA|nr:unnamed protein product [Adineta steineri]CAF4077764.1 unnamed protein product [Adineta steineri]